MIHFWLFCFWYLFSSRMGLLTDLAFYNFTTLHGKGSEKVYVYVGIPLQTVLHLLATCLWKCIFKWVDEAYNYAVSSLADDFVAMDLSIVHGCRNTGHLQCSFYIWFSKTLYCVRCFVLSGFSWHTVTSLYACCNGLSVIWSIFKF